MPRIAKELTALAGKPLDTTSLHFVGGVPGLALQVTPKSRSWGLRVAVGGKRPGDWAWALLGHQRAR